MTRGISHAGADLSETEKEVGVLWQMELAESQQRRPNLSTLGARRHEWERGWKVVAVSLLSYVFGSTGMFYAFGTFLKPLSSEFQWSRAAISGFWSISGVILGVASPGRLYPNGDKTL